MFKCMKIKYKIKALVWAVFLMIVCVCSNANASISVSRAFYELARQNNTQKIESLMYRGYSLESVDENGNNPVCLSVLRQDKKAYQTLVSYGAKKKPECLKNVPQSTYRRFFGTNLVHKAPKVYTSDTPYNTSAVLLGGGAIITAFALKGATDGSGGGKKDDNANDENNKDDGNNDDKKECQENSTYDPIAKKCVCNDGYDNFGSKTTCYKNIDNCSTQQYEKCKKCKEGYVLYNNMCTLEEDCPANSVFNPSTRKCDCNLGYGHYGDTRACYKTIEYCAEQKKNTCNVCQSNYLIDENKCYLKVAQCKAQEKDICTECNFGYGAHSGDGRTCYKNIPYCDIQSKNQCTQCVSGFGTHGDALNCYKDVEFCLVYNPSNREMCLECQNGYITHGDGKCYPEDFCQAYPNTVPVNNECVCDASRGYVGEAGNCTQVEEGEYQEGEGNRDEWDNVNEKYCNSHGIYQEQTGICQCYIGYAGTDCSECNQDVDEQGDRLYIPTDGRCYKNIKCPKDEHKTQKYDRCVCEEGYVLFDDECIVPIKCAPGMQQVSISPDPNEACQCKPNFIPNELGEGCICPTPLNGYPDSEFEYDAATDSCVQTRFDCTEKNKRGDKWSGKNCDECSSQYAVTEDETGLRCGIECAPNRAPIAQNPECTMCADGFEYNELAGNCVKVECEDGVDGYVKMNGICVCDEENGYSLTPFGVCEKKLDPLIGLKDSNINNSTITLVNNGQHRDVYGMKPVGPKDGEGKDTYYDSVYNSLNHENAVIDITNSNTGATNIYGIYAPSDIYNTASINPLDNMSSKGTIKINDSKSQSNIYGIKTEGAKNIYNAFSYNANQDTKDFKATASIDITKEKTSNGEIIGISGLNNIYNSYAATRNGTAANTEAISTINIKHNGIGTVTGIYNISEAGRINNSFAYLDSAVSDAIAKSTITVEGNSGVYGIVGKSTIINSETQFNKNFNIINDFMSLGTINAIGHSGARGEAVYGIYAMANPNNKTNIYNAMGYNSKGIINVQNNAGGSVYGIFSETEKYVERDELGNVKTDESGVPIYIYSNTYNAFRSSKAYGGDNVAATGEIKLILSGANDGEHQAIGIYSAGDVFNSYSRSGSDVKLETIGKITIEDKSDSNNMFMKAIEAGGDTVANAYGIGSNQNTQTNVAGSININKTGRATQTDIVGIFHNVPNYSKGVKIYNAALINDKSTVMGTIDITASIPYNVYGMYVDRGAEDGQIKTIYNAYYQNEEGIKDGTVVGNIHIITKAAGSGDSNAYGIYAIDSVAYNAYATNNDVNIIGNITVEARGGILGGEVVGMYGSGANAVLNNSGTKSTIKVLSTGRGLDGKANAYGMKGISGILKNEGKISSAITNSENTASNAFGMYIENGTATNEATGTITVSGNNKNYGIYAKQTEASAQSSYIYNNGTISVSGGKENYGIYADKSPLSLGKINVENNGTINITGQGTGIYASGEGVIITNTGKINITTTGENPTSSSCTGDNCNNNSAIILNGATYVNQGQMTSAGTLDLNSYNGKIVLAEGGSFEAQDKISGNLNVSASTILNTFDKTTTLKDVIKSEDVEELNIKSESYLYNTNLKLNKDSNYDVALSLKDFKDITSKDLANYYNLNYENSNNKELFNALKEAQTKEEYLKKENNLTGKYVLPNITEEKLKVARSLDRTLVSELFKKQDGVRRFVGGDSINIGRDTTTSLTGYELDSRTMYALYDKKLDNNYRLGLGLSFTHTDTDYDNNSSRKDLSIQGYIPLTYSLSNGFTAVTMARLGYEDGEYTRYTDNAKTYEADLNAISYGLLNELRYDIDLGFAKLTPFAGLNMMGWYYDSQSESGDNLALNIASSHVMSLESALGLYLDKEVRFDDKSRLKATIGVGYYHEFANPYDAMKARLVNTSGHYRLKNKVANNRDRGVISAKLGYDYKNFSIYGELMQYLEDKYPLKLDLGMRYNF